MSRILFTDGVIHPMTGREAVFSCMEVKDGVISGLYKSVPETYGGKTVSLGGKHVYPCLIDGHLHMLLTVAVMAMGFSVCSVTGDGVKPDTMRGVEQRLRDYAEKLPSGAVIAANNYIISAIDEKRLPSREELDDWCGGRAVAVYNIDGHSSALSSAMLERIGINPEGHSGILTGEAHDRNQGKLTDVIASEITLKSLAKGIGAFQNACAEYGIGTVGALEGNGDSEKDSLTVLLARLARHFDVRVAMYFQYFDVKRAEKLSRLQAHRRVGGCGEWELDGSVGSHSAAFKTPYKDTEERAECYYSDGELLSALTEASSKGFQTACHAIGDSSIAQLVRCLEACREPVFNRIEHCEFPDDETAEKLKKGKWALMMQPGYAWIDRRYLHSYERFLSGEALENMRLRSFTDAGVCVCGSSDSPVQDMDPYLQMLGMVEFYKQEESISPYEAMKTYTVNAARAILEEDSLGTLEVGKIADFFTAEKDFFTLAPAEIAAFRPCETYYGGRRCRKKKGSVPELLLMLLKKPKKI